MPRVTIRVPDDLFEAAEQLAKREKKVRDAMYVDALRLYVRGKAMQRSNPFDILHELPETAWRDPKKRRSE